MLHGRSGQIGVVYVAYLPSVDMLSAARDAHPGDTVGIVVGSSSQAMHRIVGSVAVSLARRSRVPVVVVP